MRRVSTAAIQIEQEGSVNSRRVSAAGVMVEQEGSPNQRRVSVAAVLLEYQVMTILSPAGIASEEAFGTPELTSGPPPTLSPAGIASKEAFGVPTLTGGAQLTTAASLLPRAAVVEADHTSQVTLARLAGTDLEQQP